MRIRMLETAKGSPDGARVYEYTEGDEHSVDGYLMSFDLAHVFVAQDLAVEVDEPEAAESDQEAQGDALTGETPASDAKATPAPRRARTR